MKLGYSFRKSYLRDEKSLKRSQYANESLLNLPVETNDRCAKTIFGNFEN